MDIASQGTQGEDTNEGVEDSVSEETYVLGPHKWREDTNAPEKDTGKSDDTDIADTDGSEDTDEVSKYGGSEDIAVQIT